MKLIYWIAAAVAIGLLGAGFTINPPSTSADVAAWVQAFGAIAGIGIAIGLSESQAKRAALQQVEAHAARYAELYGPAIAIIAAMKTQIDALLQEVTEDHRQSRTGDYQDFMTTVSQMNIVFFSIPIHTMPTVVSAQCVIETRALFGRIEQVCTEFCTTAMLDVDITQTQLDELIELRDRWDYIRVTLREDLVKATLPIKQSI